LLTKSDPTALADAAIGLLLDEPRRRHMGRAARAVAEREFDARLQIERTVEVYEEARARLVARAR
jgi:glycosyltransferase involved in cell wall biosynthesis